MASFESVLAPLPVLAQKTDVAALHERPKKRHQVAKACQHCAVSHLSCSEVRPCERCIKKGLDCSERPRKSRRPLGRTASHSEFQDGDDVADEPATPSPRPTRARKNKRKAVSGPDEEYVPEGECDGHDHDGHDHHHHAHEKKIPSLFSLLPGQTVSPTSGSPRSALHSDSSDEPNSDLESLVVAALAGQSPSFAEPKLEANQGMFDPMFLQAMGMMPMMPLLPSLVPQAPNMQPLGYPVQFNPLDPFGMMQFQIPLQWRFQGQPMATQLVIPLSASVRDLYAMTYNRLVFDRLLQPSERIAINLALNNQHFVVDEQLHAMMPLTLVGLNDPSALLEVVKYTPKQQ